MERTANQIEDALVVRLCERNGWEYDGEDYTIALVDVRWFIENYTQLTKDEK